MYLTNQAKGIFAKPRRRIGLGGINDVDEVMGNFGEFPCIGFGRADIHTAIDLRRIDADDFQRKARGKRHGESGLATSSGPHEEHRVAYLGITHGEFCVRA